MAGITDKAVGQELLAGPARLALMSDTPVDYPAWEIRWENVRTEPKAYVAGPVKVRVVEAGPVRATLEVTRTIEGSTITQRIQLTASGPSTGSGPHATTACGDQVAFDTTIDWKTRGCLLKAVFPLTSANPLATYDLGLGTIQRPNDSNRRYEVPAQQWADLSAPDGSFGVAVLNNCKYGWDKPADNTLRLTLVRTPNGRQYEDQQTQDIGQHRLAYAIAGHKGAWRRGRRRLAGGPAEPAAGGVSDRRARRAAGQGVLAGSAEHGPGGHPALKERRTATKSSSACRSSPVSRLRTSG